MQVLHQSLANSACFFFLLFCSHYCLYFLTWQHGNELSVNTSPWVDVNSCESLHEAFFNPKSSADGINAWIDRWSCLYTFSSVLFVWDFQFILSCSWWGRFLLICIHCSLCMKHTSDVNSLKYTSVRYAVWGCFVCKISSCFKLFKNLSCF